MKIQKKRSFLKKSFAIIFGLIFICQIFITFSNLNNLNLQDFGFGYNPSSDANSNFENIEVDDEITQEWEKEHNFDYPEDSDVRLLNFNEIEMNLEVCISDLEIEDITTPTGEVYQRLSIEEGGHLGEVGCPKLPFRTVKILLPYGKDLEDIEIDIGKEQVLEVTYKIEPVQAPIPIGSTEIPAFYLNESIYNSAIPFPEECYSVVGIYNSRGYRILILNLYPVCYIPKTGEISHFKDMNVRINLIDSTEANSLFRGIKKDEDHVVELVDTPQLIDTYGSGSFILQSNGNVMGDSGPYDYVIITNEFLKNSNGTYTFQDLAAAKNASGIQTKIVTVEDIYDNYDGTDNQTKIRNFIIDAYQNWGIEYVLLGGDGDGADVGGESGDDIIPAKILGDFASDLYYASLDGIWTEDISIDLLAEVYIGRAPVDSIEELSNFIMKTLAHEAALASNDPYINKVLMVGEYLGFGGIADWGGNYMDEIINGSSAHGYFTAGFPKSYNIETLYERDINWTKTDLISKINDGVHIINHMGHAYITNVMKLFVNVTPNDVDLLQNNKYFFGYSQGCYAGAFDNMKDMRTGEYFNYDCIVEHLVTSEHGAFAFIANSRYGPEISHSTDSATQRCHREFIDAIFGEGIEEIGRANQDSKEDNIGYIFEYGWEGDMFICYLEINLFGDPTAKLYDFHKDIIYEPIFIDGSASGVGAHNWTWAEQQDWCSGSGTLQDPYVIENVTIEDYNFGNCIEIINSNKFFILKDCTFYNSSTGSFGAGIKLVNVTNAQIINNTCSYNNRWGIYLENCNNNIILENTVNNNTDPGIYLCYSDNNTVSRNAINNTRYGIFLRYSNENTLSENIEYNNRHGIFLIHSYNNTFSKNIVFNTHLYGIYLWKSNDNIFWENNVKNNTYGIMLFSVDNSTISGNIINNNAMYGIYLRYDCNYNTISGNNIAKNNRYGVFLGSLSNNNSISANTINLNLDIGINIQYSSSNNTIYHNNFIDNALQARDHNPGKNKWYHPDLLEGNYWSNYPGVDDGSGEGKHSIAGDGIGDTNIPWPHSGYDYYPLINPYIGWSFDIRLTNASGYSWFVSSAIDSENKTHICWADDRDGNLEVYYNCFDGFNWTGEQRVTNDSGFSIPTSIAIGPDDKIHIVWLDYYDIYYTYYDGITWSEKQNLTSSGWATDALITVDEDNKIHLIWADGRDDPIHHYTEIYYKSFSGKKWSKDHRVTKSPNHSYIPSIALDQDGKLHVIFSDNRDDNWKIYYTSYDGEEWTEEVNITEPSDNLLRGNIVIGLDNIAHFLWAEEIADNQFELYYKSYDIDNATWSNQELIPLDDLIVADVYPPIFLQSIIVSQDNRLYVTWTDSINGNTELFYIYKDQSGWSPENQLTFAQGQSVLPNIIVTKENKIFIFWNDDRDGNFEIYYKYTEI